MPEAEEEEEEEAPRRRGGAGATWISSPLISRGGTDVNSLSLSPGTSKKHNRGGRRWRTSSSCREIRDAGAGWLFRRERESYAREMNDFYLSWLNNNEGEKGGRDDLSAS